ncbi:MAG: hypothetical protein KDK05_19020 [Candidatus Competibacteraceae bacterium]|nr:hypothetical protein [Caldilineaceae bacterium]MCB1717221.1 hypothetical protein [Candidatus Competibacteraceae bacterium]
MSSNRAQYTEQVMQAAAGATGNGTAIDANGFTEGSIQIDGISGDTITFEGTLDGVTWHPIRATSSAGTTATTATADGIYYLVNFVLHQIRARISTYSAGTIDVLGRLSA